MVIRWGLMVSYAACISMIRDCQRATNSRRCVANGIGRPDRNAKVVVFQNPIRAGSSSAPLAVEAVAS